MYWMYGLILLSLLALFYFQDASRTKEVDWTDFEKAALLKRHGQNNGVLRNPHSGRVHDRRGGKKHKFNTSSEFDGDKKITTTIPSSDKIQEKIDSWNAALQAEGKPLIKVNYEKGSDLMKLFRYFDPILLLVIFMVYMSKRMSGGAGGGGIFNVGKSRATVFDKDNGSTVTFKDVAKPLQKQRLRSKRL